ncbi:hypothetical protein IWX81_001316 [Salinibacterium sp. CAN_S4]|uniref:helix-turn-helix domain-containing protein n=1 Tax=Salinibacterium sp. CAN_S4 TaxID=2787727 RepID=UPI0018EFC952
MVTKNDKPLDDGPTTVFEELNCGDVGARMRELSQQSWAVAELIDDARFADDGRKGHKYGHEESMKKYETEMRERFRRTVSGMRAYRRNYNSRELVVAEYALTKMNYTQRDAAALLGVGVSTINRWAQNPLPIDEYR